MLKIFEVSVLKYDSSVLMIFAYSLLNPKEIYKINSKINFNENFNLPKV